ncbi:MAG: T9SS type A sorting domain-containing protein [Bacteroidota bacterium]
MTYAPLQAQHLEQFTWDELQADTLYNSLSEVYQIDGHFYCIGEMSWNNFSTIRKPTVKKVDTLGRVVWQLEELRIDQKPDDFIGHIDHIHKSPDGLLYLFFRSERFSSYGIWQIDDTNGEVLYNYYFDPALDYSNSIIFPFSEDVFLFFHENNQDQHFVALFDAKQRSLLQSHQLFQGSTYDLSSNMVYDGDSSFYFAASDKVYKASIYGDRDTIWQQQLPSVSGLTVKRLQYDRQNNALFAFGAYDRARNGIAARLQPDTGQLLWLAKTTENFHGVNFQDVAFTDNDLFVTWRHRTVGGGTPVGVLATRINRADGTSVWEQNYRSHPTKITHESALDIQVDEEGVYLTGYYHSSNYGPGDWSVSKLDREDGSILFRTLVTDSPQRDLENQGIGIFPYRDKIICLGQKGEVDNPYLTHDYLVTMDKTSGVVQDEKILSQPYRYPSKTVGFAQIGEQHVMGLQQIGAKARFFLNDEQGNLQWDTILLAPGNLPFQGDLLKPISDSLVLVGGITWPTVESYLLQVKPQNSPPNVFFVVFNPYTRKFVDQGQFDKFYNTPMAGALQDPLGLKNEYYFSFTNEGSRLYHYKVQTDPVGDTTIVVSFTSTGSISAPFPNFKLNNQPLVDTKGAYLLSLTEDQKWAGLQKRRLSQKVYYPANNWSNLYTGLYDINDSLIVVCGRYERFGYPMISIVNRNDLDNSQEYFFTFTEEGFSKKSVAGEGDSILYTLVSDTNRLFVHKFNLKQRENVWMKEISLSNPYLKQIIASDMAFNKTGNYITVAGYIPNPGMDGNTIFFDILTTDGRILSHNERKGDFPGDNQCISLLALEGSSTTLLGGSYHEENYASSAFVFYLDAADIDKTINAKVFLDLDEDGIQGEDEPNIALGSFTIDDRYQVYPDNNGEVNTSASPGVHRIAYQIPDGWQLSTDSFAYQINPYHPDSSDTRLCFGVYPDSLIDQVEAFIAAETFICNELTPTFLKLKNTGTSLQDVRLELNADLRYISAETPPDSVDGESLYWDFEQFLPGQSLHNKLLFRAPDASSLGDTLSILATVYLLDPASQMPIDTFSFHYQEILLCAYDPNDKQVSPLGQGADGQTLFGETLYYTIRFQNTGNYPARNVRIVDTLDQNLDLSTFEFLQASHPITEVKQQEGTLEFIFENIYLPDSVNNEPESHGFVSFRILPKEGLPERTTILNSASIYFDQNDPILTNTTQNQLVSAFNLISSTEQVSEMPFVVFPNPTQQNLFVQFKESTNQALNWQVHDLLGRSWRSGTLEVGKHQIQLDGLPDGVYFLDIDQRWRVKVLLLR